MRLRDRLQGVDLTATGGGPLTIAHLEALERAGVFGTAYCEQAPTLVSHRAHPLCKDGWHAMRLYTREANPTPDHFNGAILGAEIRFEPDLEAPPITDFWELGEGETDADYHAYIVRFRQEGRE